MSNQATLHENWEAIKENLREKWKELTEDDLDSAKGDIHQLVQAIQRKTGDASESIENYFGELLASSNKTLYQAGESIRGGVEHAKDSVRETYAGIEDAVRHRPASSVALGFAAGILTGLTLTLLMRRR